MQHNTPSAEGTSYCCGFHKVQRYDYCDKINPFYCCMFVDNI